MKTATMDRLALMHTFVRIVEAGTLSAAAEQLAMSQPTISRRLRALESTLGLRLLSRNTHTMQLTDAGQRYFARAKEFLADWEGFEAELRGQDDMPEGVLRVVVPHAFGQSQLVTPALEYLRRYPGVTLEWKLHDGPLRLVADAVDCVIRVGAVNEESVVARKIGEVPRIVIASPTLAGAQQITRPQQLARLPWIALGTYYRNTVKLERERSDAVSLRIQPRLVTDSLFALRNAALGGLGAAVVSQWAVADDIAQGRLLHLVPSWHSQPLPIYLAYPQARFYPAKLRRFVEIVRHAFSEAPKQ